MCLQLQLDAPFFFITALAISKQPIVYDLRRVVETRRCILVSVLPFLAEGFPCTLAGTVVAQQACLWV